MINPRAPPVRRIPRKQAGNAIEGAAMRSLFLSLAIIAGVGLGAVGHGNAQALRGDQFLAMLSGERAHHVPGFVNKANGMGYLQGVLDAYMVFSTRDPGLRIYCMPAEGISVAQAREIVIKWLELHPNRLQEQARILIFHALADSFPCRQE
jgi:hypothetical protein